MLINAQRVTNLEDRDVRLSFRPSVVHSHQSVSQASEQSLTTSLSQGVSKRLLDTFPVEGFSYLQGFSFDAMVDVGIDGKEKAARYLVGQSLNIIVPT